jgi:heme iron utilization protein
MHESRLDRALRALLNAQRIASLGTLGVEGRPFVSMVPFAIEPGAACLVIHVSLLAPHTRNLLTNPAVSLMVMQPEVAGQPVHALPRVSLDGNATRLQPESPGWVAARQAYLARFPEAEPMTQLGDFSFVAIHPTAARQVAGFGAARPLEAAELADMLRMMPG